MCRECDGDESCGNGQKCVCNGSFSICQDDKQTIQEIQVEVQVEKLCSSEITVKNKISFLFVIFKGF